MTIIVLRNQLLSKAQNSSIHFNWSQIHMVYLIIKRLIQRSSRLWHFRSSSAWCLVTSATAPSSSCSQPSWSCSTNSWKAAFSTSSYHTAIFSCSSASWVPTADFCTTNSSPYQWTYSAHALVLIIKKCGPQHKMKKGILRVNILIWEKVMSVIILLDSTQSGLFQRQDLLSLIMSKWSWVSLWESFTWPSASSLKVQMPFTSVDGLIS